MGELYYEEHQNVAVLFATITDAELVSGKLLPHKFFQYNNAYGIFLGEEVAQLSEKGVLGVLNTIICAFDTVIITRNCFYIY